MSRAEPVTSDWQVAKAMCGVGTPLEEGLCWLSGEIAETLGITVFQITARLKGMEGRGLTERYEGYWRLTSLGFQLGSGPEPPKKIKPPLGERVYQTPTGGYYTPGVGSAALPDDSSVPHRSEEDAHGWTMRKEWGPKHREIGLSMSFIEIFVDPEGVEWVRCAPTEPAELICGETRVSRGLPAMRLRRRNGSTSVERKVRRDEDRAEELVERKRVKRKLYA